MTTLLRNTERLHDQWLNDYISPGNVGSVGDVLMDVRLKQSAPDMDMRYLSLTHGKNESRFGSNVQNGTLTNFFNFGPATAIDHNWNINRGKKYKIGFKFQNLQPPDKTPSMQTMEGGQFLMQDGKLTGLLVDNAVGVVDKMMPAATTEDYKNWLISAQQNCFATGLTTITDCGLSPSDIDQVKFIKQKWSASLLKLVSQHRVKGGMDYINYIDNLLHCRLEKGDSKFESEHYEFVLYDWRKKK